MLRGEDGGTMIWGPVGNWAREENDRKGSEGRVKGVL